MCVVCVRRDKDEVAGAIPESPGTDLFQAGQRDRSGETGVCRILRGVEELRQRFVSGNPRVLRTGDMTVDLNNQAELARNLEFLRSVRVRTEPPFARPDINETQKVIDKLKAAMSLPLSN